MKRQKRIFLLLLALVMLLIPALGGGLLTGCAAPVEPAEGAPAMTAAPVTSTPTIIPTEASTPVPAESEYYRDSRMLVYADHIVENGLHLQAGDEVLISAPPITSRLVELITEACYARGASAVNVVYEELARNYAAMRYAEDGAYDELVFSERLNTWLSIENSSVCFLLLLSPRFDLVRPDAAARESFSEAELAFLYGIKDWNKSQYPPDKKWCIAACGNADWAKKVYPELTDAEAVAALWEDIFSFVYLDESSTTGSVAATHARELDTRAKALTEMHIESLHFVGGETDVTVRLHQPNIFQGSSAANAGETYLPNIPGEECFTLPEKTGVNGRVAASRPLVLEDGTVIENMRLTFADGYVTEWSADAGKEALDELLTTENARYLGEVAMVSANSPIYRAGKVYYITLFDENATCHMAFGDALVDYNLPAGTEPDEQVNRCDIHVDFMFGTDDMEITATLMDGTEKTIMHEGVWAF